ncbi:hypothetical protein [Archangium lansingense]|uniref:Uncharacterized protein n=1 Tax=Archangium lansingense TaxID=2995310 RepID=A0ABT3ZXG6_9BACT|nr:hypothetical protein [Archangium lansinium]MCY1074090.1 hypothetical protein [Archangium lansinium]
MKLEDLELGERRGRVKVNGKGSRRIRRMEGQLGRDGWSRGAEKGR